MINKRIDNLELMEASYLDKKPSVVSWHIVKWQPNKYYYNKDKFVKLNNEFYCYPNNTSCRVHKSLFKNKEYNYAIASFEYNKRNNCYEFKYIEDRPIYLNKEEKEIFFELIKYGFHQLNKSWYN